MKTFYITLKVEMKDLLFVTKDNMKKALSKVIVEGSAMAFDDHHFKKTSPDVHNIACSIDPTIEHIEEINNE